MEITVGNTSQDEGGFEAGHIRTNIARMVKASQTDINDEAEDRQRVGVHSLGRAFAILGKYVSPAQDNGIVGYIRQEKDSRRYRVGRPLFAVAASALDEIEMVNVATPILEDLSRETGESRHFAVRKGDSVMVIARTGGPGAFQLTDLVGVVRPAHCTALVKVILASLRHDQLDRLLKRVELKPSTEKSITEVPVLLREIAEIRRSGAAFDGEFNLKVRCVAVPVRDFTAQIIGARHLRPGLAPPVRPCKSAPTSCKAPPRVYRSPSAAPARRRSLRHLESKQRRFGR